MITLRHCAVCQPEQGWRRMLGRLRLIRWTGGFCEPCSRREMQVRRLQRSVRMLEERQHALEKRYRSSIEVRNEP